MDENKDLKEFEVIVETKLISYDKLKIKAKSKEEALKALNQTNKIDKHFKCRHEYSTNFKELGVEAYFSSSWSDHDITSIKYNNSEIKELEPVNVNFNISLSEDEKSIFIKSDSNFNKKDA